MRIDHDHGGIHANTWHVHCGYRGGGDESRGRLLFHGNEGHAVPQSRVAACGRRAQRRGEQSWRNDRGGRHAPLDPGRRSCRIGGRAC